MAVGQSHRVWWRDVNHGSKSVSMVKLLVFCFLCCLLGGLIIGKACRRTTLRHGRSNWNYTQESPMNGFELLIGTWPKRQKSSDKGSGNSGRLAVNSTIFVPPFRVPRCLNSIVKSLPALYTTHGTIGPGRRRQWHCRRNTENCGMMMVIGCPCPWW